MGLGRRLLNVKNTHKMVITILSETQREKKICEERKGRKFICVGTDMN